MSAVVSHIGVDLVVLFKAVARVVDHIIIILIVGDVIGDVIVEVGVVIVRRRQRRRFIVNVVTYLLQMGDGCLIKLMSDER